MRKELILNCRMDKSDYLKIIHAKKDLYRVEFSSEENLVVNEKQIKNLIKNLEEMINE